jgi:hypothetical protein
MTNSGDGTARRGAEGEVAVEALAAADAGLVFIGRIRTPWTDRRDCPRQGREDGPLCRIELFEPWVAALDGIAAYARLEVLYWLHQARRDLVRQSPRDDGATRGTFAAHARAPEPVSTAVVRLEAPRRHPSSAGWTASTARRCSTSSPALVLPPPAA